MHIVILGAGALGGYFGSRWEEAGADVTFLVREKRAAQLRKNGMGIHSGFGDYTITDPAIVTDAREIDHPDLVLVSVKGYNLEGVFDTLKVLTEKGAFVLPVLNGIEHINALQKYLGKDSVIGGLAFIIATLDKTGHVEHSSNFHTLIFGPLAPVQTDFCRRLEAMSDKAGMKVINSDSIMQELWKKYMFINAFSGITTAVNLPIGPIRDNIDSLTIAENILTEMQQLAYHYDVELSDENVEEGKSKMMKLGNEATSSMHQDRRKGLPLELDHLHGGAIRLAKAKGIEIPYIKAVHGMIKPFERVK